MSAAPAPCWSAAPRARRRSRWTAINACLVPAAGYVGQEVLTAEGLGTPEALHPVQQEMADRGGSQCGYCTPGFVCAMAGEYYRPDRTPSGQTERVAAPSRRPTGTPPPAARPPTGRPTRPPPGTAADHEHGPNGFDLHALSGNLCRCTGYRPIRDAAYALPVPGLTDPLATAANSRPHPAATRIAGAYGTFVRPATLTEALDLLADEPDAARRGSTDWAVELNLRHARGATEHRHRPAARAAPPRGHRPAHRDRRRLTLSEVERGLAGRVPLLDALFPQFASRLIRNGATLGGNLGTGSRSATPSPRCWPRLLTRPGRPRRRARGGLTDFFTGYRQSVLRPGELIRSIRIPLPVAPVSAFHKIAKRRFDDISSVAVAYP